MTAFPWAISAVLAALCLPVTLLSMREVIRRKRSAILEDLLETLFKDTPDIPTLEFARNKYEPPEAKSAKSDLPVSRFAKHALFFAAIPFLLMSIVGFLFLLEPLCVLISSNECPSGWLPHALLWVEPGNAKTLDARLSSATAIAAAAFLGGYLFTLRTLLRAVMNFELSPITWLRAAIHVLSGMALSVLLYRSLSGTNYLSNVLQLASGTPSESDPLRLWIAIAFVAGYAPDFGLVTLVRYLHISYIKTVDSEVLKSVSTVPIELIDGIDYDIRYRLEETNIVDVQNLATYNPILLYVETPYGLYETFDWVLQAQLCLVVGVKTFLGLKKHNIRTIFDLERAVLSDDAPSSFVRMIGALLYADANPDMRKLIATKAASVESPEELDVASVCHAVAVMCDDLHIHRLRQLWSVMHEQLTRDGREWLYRTKPLADAA